MSGLIATGNRRMCCSAEFVDYVDYVGWIPSQILSKRKRNNHKLQLPEGCLLVITALKGALPWEKRRLSVQQFSANQNLTSTVRTVAYFLDSVQQSDGRESARDRCKL